MAKKLTIEQKYPNITDREHVLSKDMWAGTRKTTESTEFIIDETGVGRLRTVKYSPALMKLIDEPLVNALDQFMREPKMREIRVTFDKNGEVTIYNDGPGLEVEKHSELGVYVPQMVFGMLFKGSNVRADENSIVGGTNGVGAKISNIMSTQFTVETVDIERDKYYRQTWHNNMEIVDNPIVIELAVMQKKFPQLAVPHTSLKFTPDYVKLFDYASGATAYEQLIDIVRTRVYMAANYGAYCCPGRKCRVVFNGAEINCDAPKFAAMLFPGMPTFTTIMSPATMTANGKPVVSKYKYPWQVTAVVLQDDNNGYNQISNVNGVVVRQGRHTRKIYNLIIDAVEENITKVFKDKNVKFNKSYVTSYMFIIVNAQIPCPSWTGQRKDELETPIQDFAHYSLDPKFTAQIASKLKDTILSGMLNQKDINIAKTSKLEYDKYISAANLRNPFNSPPAMLLAAEGDSANEQMKNAFRNVKQLNNDRFGFISLGGVIMNARREITTITAMDGTRKQRKSQQLLNNALFKALIIVLGLNLNYKYDSLSPTYKREISELRYSCIVGCVDQDLDGVGNIFTLLLSMFEVLWPNLYKVGFIKRFATPILRAYPRNGGKVMSFYSEADYEDWVAELERAGKTVKTYRVNYYKGLGSHNRDESIKMVENFHQYLLTYYLDENSHSLFEVYCGDDPELRKQTLSRPTKTLDRERIREQLTTKMISCSDHLESEANIFQKDNIERHLDSAIDGFNQATRKIYHGAWQSIGTSKDPIKVAQLAGDIAKREDYHHGENVMGDSLKKQAFVAVGGKQLPIFVPYGNFGTRSCGGKASASVRYVKVRFNAEVNNLVYPPQDYQLLKFTFQEGNRSTPKYFVPIIPTGITESNFQPGHGWQIQTWSKDALDIIRIVRTLIRTEVYMSADRLSVFTMPIPEPSYYVHGWTGKIAKIQGKSCSIGKYTYDNSTNVIHITELPYRTWTNDYIEKLRKLMTVENPIVVDVKDNSDDRNINIRVTLSPDGYTRILNMYSALPSNIDAIIEYLKLRDSMNNQINLIGSNDEVVEFEDYAAVIRYWFPLRRDMYYARMDRIEVITNLKILMTQNIIRYIKERDNIGVSKCKLTDLIARLTEMKFDKIYRARISDPDFLPTNKLRDVILYDPAASYDYLIDLTDRAKTADALVKQEEKLAELINHLETMNARRQLNKLYLWEEELDKLEHIINDGKKTNWMFDESGKYIL